MTYEQDLAALDIYDGPATKCPGCGASNWPGFDAPGEYRHTSWCPGGTPVVVRT